jgi:hypothetical protein
MAQNFSQLIAKTRMFLDEVSPKSWSDTEVQREVNYAYHDVVTTVMTTYEDYYMTAPVFVNIIDAQQEYGVADGLPQNTFKLRRVEMNYASNTGKQYVKAAPIRDISAIRDSIMTSGTGSATLRPMYYVYGFSANFHIGIIPVPSKDAPNGIKVWYIPTQSDLVNPTDEPNIPYPERYATIIPLMAAGNLLRKGQQEEVVAAKYLDDADKMKQDLMQELEDRISDDGRVILDSIGYDTDFTSGI